MSRVIAVSLVLLAAAAPAEASKRFSTFSGSCQFAVTVRFEPPLTAVAQPGSAFAHGSGPCSGSFIDWRGRTRLLDGDRVRYVAWSSGSGDCAQGTAQGGGYLSHRGSRLAFRLSEERVTGVAALEFEGRHGGRADGTARVDAEQLPPAEIAQRCMRSGLSSAPVDIDFASTGISG